MILVGCNPFTNSNHIKPNMDSFDDKEIVFRDVSEPLFYLADEKGTRSGPYRIYVNSIDELGNQVYISGTSNPITWGPDGRYLVMISAPYAVYGSPILLSEDGSIINCLEDNLPVTEHRAWLVEDKKVVSVDISSRPNRVLIYDFDTCKVDKILYQGAEDEWLYEATLSSKGWLAIALSTFNGLEIRIIDPEGNDFSIAEGETPAWSRDGEYLAYVIDQRGLFYSNKMGQDSTLVQEGVDSYLGYPSWSFDGDWIMFGEHNNGERVISIKNPISLEKKIIIKHAIYASWRWVDFESQ